MRRLASRFLLAAVMLAGFSPSAYSCTPNGDTHCSMLYIFEAPAFGILNAYDPTPPLVANTASSNTIDAVLLNNHDTYIASGVPLQASNLANVLQPLRQSTWNPWRGQFILSFDSYQTFIDDVYCPKTGTPNPASDPVATCTQIDPRVQAVMYDNETWSNTPLAEQQNPVHYSGLFSALAHKQGWSVIFTPSCALLHVMNPTTYSVTNSFTDYWPNCATALLAPLAQYADIIDFQLQGDEANTANYIQLVNQAAPLVKSYNPSVKFIAEISTDGAMKNSGATVQNLITDAQGVYNSVDGFYMETETTQADAFTTINYAVQILQAMPAAQ